MSIQGPHSTTPNSVVTGEYIMVVIGLTGGIGSGKSFVLELLHKRYDIPVFEADKVAKDLMMPPNDIYKDVVHEFGESILEDVDETSIDRPVEKPIDREKLRQIVMNDEKSLARLNAIVHPGVKKYFKDIIASDNYSVIIIESAILLQDGYDEICDEIWYVRADRVTRRNRIMKDRGYTYEKANSFMDNQPDDDYYMEHADRVINNNHFKGLELLIPEVDSVIKSFKEKYPFFV